MVKKPAQAISRLMLALLLALGFFSCENAEQESPPLTTTSSVPQGIAQARLDENGLPELAFAVAPTSRSHPSPSIGRLHGQDLFSLTNRAAKEEAARARTIDRFQKQPGNLYSLRPHWSLRTVDIGPLEVFETNEGIVNGFGVGEGEGHDAIVYASDGYLVFEGYISLQGIQEISFNHGELSGRARFWRDGHALRLQVNDQAASVVAPNVFGAHTSLPCGGDHLDFPLFFRWNMATSRACPATCSMITPEAGQSSPTHRFAIPTAAPLTLPERRPSSSC